GDLEALYTQIDRAISSWLELN
ncbi:MAG: dephospho-CoA kinase, partial [Microcystis panniformis]